MNRQVLQVVVSAAAFAFVAQMVAQGLSPALAQAPAPGAAKPSFEVASVKPNKSSSGGMSWAEQPGGRLTALNIHSKLGPQLKPSDVDCAALAAAQGAGGSALRGGGSGPAPLSPMRTSSGPCSMTMTAGTLRFWSVTIASLAATLSSATQRMVVDRTGLAGSFDFDLTFSREPSPDTTLPSLFTAVQEQLGLKLDSMRVPMNVLVIDDVERPTPD